MICMYYNISLSLFNGFLNYFSNFHFTVISTVIGMSIYASYTPGYTYHWSYWLGWFGNCIIVVATCMCVHDARRPTPPGQIPMLGDI